MGTTIHVDMMLALEDGKGPPCGRGEERRGKSVACEIVDPSPRPPRPIPCPPLLTGAGRAAAGAAAWGAAAWGAAARGAVVGGTGSAVAIDFVDAPGAVGVPVIMGTGGKEKEAVVGRTGAAAGSPLEMGTGGERGTETGEERHQ